MKYENIRPAIFLHRPNRFVAEIELDGRTEICHVKNTGRCQELLIPGVRVWVQEQDSHKRKTKYDLITVQKGDRLVNIDSQVPNKVVARWLPHSGLFRNLTAIYPEFRFGGSRFDFCVEEKARRVLIEVKGVTLEQGGVALFPDAPTIRGVKHLRELMTAVEQGYDAMVLFLIQMKNVSHMEPNWQTHEEFGLELRAARAAGVKILALDCHVTPDSIAPGNDVAVNLMPSMGQGANEPFFEKRLKDDFED
ncbi:MAG: DNA/RNA nuclease SfsA [Clostridiaceae bacterium]|nr:DNA/RNA nuclease SfsA [Clostridiaceae bacterium]